MSRRRFHWLRHPWRGAADERAERAASTGANTERPKIAADVEALELLTTGAVRAWRANCSGTTLVHCKSPRPAPGALAHTAGCRLPADLEAAATTPAAIGG